jgi:hypothetical protein
MEEREDRSRSVCPFAVTRVKILLNKWEELRRYVYVNLDASSVVSRVLELSAGSSTFGMDNFHARNGISCRDLELQKVVLKKNFGGFV